MERGTSVFAEHQKIGLDDLKGDRRFSDALCPFSIKSVSTSWVVKLIILWPEICELETRKNSVVKLFVYVSLLLK